MNWHDVCLILTVFFGVFGVTFLAACVLSLNTVVGERSKKDGRMLMEKQNSGSWQDYHEARQEMVSLMPEAWAKQRVTRWLVYFGLAFFVLARILGEWATPLQSPRRPPGSPNHALQRTQAGGGATPASRP